MPRTCRLPLYAAAVSLLVPLSLQAQSVPWATTLAPAISATPLPEDRGADGLAQTLNKLRTWGSLMMIVAHPDDEDGGMLAYESRGAGVRTTLMTLTRGEGGQNAMSGEEYDGLGLIRTNELLAADRYYGTQQLWGTEADFGFSKTQQESFAQWGRERVLRDVVRAVREERPLVLTSVFIGGITDGHGQHQVSGEMTQEAFNAAGDPHVFPDQIAAGLRPWKPLAVFARVPFAPITARGMYDYATETWAPPSFTNYVTGAHTTTPPTADVTIPEGQWDPVLGRSYLQMAREGWGLQKSQYGGGNPPLAGPDRVGYHRYGSRVTAPAGANGFFAGIDTSLPGMTMLAHGGDTAFVHAGLEQMDKAATQAFWGYTPGVPGRIVPYLLDFYRAASALRTAVATSGLTPDSKADLTHELDIKLVQCNTALIEALGLHLDALLMPPATLRDNGTIAERALGLSIETTPTHVTPGEDFDVRLHITAASPWTSAGSSLRLLRTGLMTPEAEHWQVARMQSPGLDRVQSDVGEAIFHVEVPLNAAPTAPYFTRPSIEQPYYDLSNSAFSGRSFAPYPVSGFAEFDDDGVPIHLGEVVQADERELGRGNFETPLVVTPGLSVTLPESVAVLPRSAHSLALEVSVANEQLDATGAVLALHAPTGWRVEPADAKLTLGPGERATQSFTVMPPSGTSTGATLQAEARSGNSLYTSGFTTAGYPGLRPYNLYRQAKVQVHSVDVRVTPGTRVAYVMGTGDTVPAALRAIGVPVDLLTPADLLTHSLKSYSAVVLGVRTYTADPSLARASGALQQFAADGGTVVVQYQSGDFPGMPYDLRLTRTPAKVVEENSPVTLLAPANPLLTTPNRITAADFDGWFEERGHGFAASWAPEWTPLVSTADPAQAPQQGGLLVAKVGRGRYIYEALALYRQLPQGVPGAYQLLANLVSARP